MAAGETVLYYNPDPDASTGKMTGVFFRMKMRIRRVSEQEIGEQVGYLAGLPGFEAGGADTGGGVISEEMMVLSGLSDSRLNELLSGLRKAGAPRIDLKAMITPANRGWSFYQLYEEIKKEHEEMHSQPS